MMLATAVHKGWAIWKLDTQTEFLYGDVEEEV